jgi:hypothetical protein
MAARSSSKPCRRLSAHLPMHRWSSVNARERRLRIVNCGDFCGDLSYILAHLATSQINSPQLPNRLNLRGLQGFLPSIQQVSIFDGNGLRNQRSTGPLFEPVTLPENMFVGALFLRGPIPKNQAITGAASKEFLGRHLSPLIGAYNQPGQWITNLRAIKFAHADAGVPPAFRNSPASRCCLPL